MMSHSNIKAEPIRRCRDEVYEWSFKIPGNGVPQCHKGYGTGEGGDASCNIPVAMTINILVLYVDPKALRSFLPKAIRLHFM